MDNIDVITSRENTIIERLAEKIQGVKIEAFPDEPKKLRLNHPKGHILVQYAGSDFSKSLLEDENYISQERNMKFIINVVTRSLRGHQGAYAYLENCRKALTGYQIEECQKMYPIGDDFKDWSSEDGIWTYGIVFIVPVITNEEFN